MKSNDLKWFFFLHQIMVWSALLYLNGGDDLAKPLSRVEKAGDKILIPDILRPNGFKALIMDTEGNRVAFHSMK